MLNRLADYHTHTVRCGHATGSMEAYVEAAIARGLGEIGFSDHVPMYWLPEERRDPTCAMAMAELEEYVSDVLRIRERYPEIPVRLGLEADYVPGHEEALSRLLEAYPWDYVIGSVHFLGEWNFDHPDYVRRYDEWDIGALYDRFFALERAAAESGLFDFLAHIDLIKKFGHRPAHSLDAAYAELADAIARAGVAIELSTAGLRKPVGEVYPAPALLRACCERGVPLVISSDAHAPGEVGWGFEDARDLALRTGFTQVARFEGRRRRMVPLA
ncbi:histidinol-phosphatase (PHP family) [Symbiobacterium terraclitae]|uniref:Histidinol-phosphatase n=1 Tax=Symbiobacterium terraclitae TaxID=557451 RepID=A0ABS4JY15_9FIRM|nr:histidinol-phosphatase (PHP family) [Symbiobacterium terraclitae]